MKYCRNCGSELKENANFCDICGASSQQIYQTHYNPNPSQYQYNERKTNVMAIIGLITAFIIPLLGWIFGGIGLSNVKKCNSGKGLAIAALIVATVNWLLGLLLQLYEQGLIG